MIIMFSLTGINEFRNMYKKLENKEQNQNGNEEKTINKFDLNALKIEKNEVVLKA